MPFGLTYGMYTHNVTPLQANILGVFIWNVELKKKTFFLVTKNFQKLIRVTNLLSLAELDWIYKIKLNKIQWEKMNDLKTL